MSKHPPPDRQPADLPDDIERNPLIGQSPGVRAQGRDLHLIKGENTVEGYVKNDLSPTGEADPDHRGRENE